MKREFMIERQGRSFVLYAGLLDEAHRAGLRAIRTKLLQSPSADNGNIAICYAEVETERGTFSGIGDATPDNIGRTVAPHFIRMAETRAKARALRDAINVGAVAVEELADLDEEQPPYERNERNEVIRTDGRIIAPAVAPDAALAPLLAEFDELAATAKAMRLRPPARPTTVATATAAIAGLRASLARASSVGALRMTGAIVGVDLAAFEGATAEVVGRG